MHARSELWEKLWMIEQAIKCNASQAVHARPGYLHFALMGHGSAGLLTAASIVDDCYHRDSSSRGSAGLLTVVNNTCCKSQRIAGHAAHHSKADLVLDLMCM